MITLLALAIALLTLLSPGGPPEAPTEGSPAPHIGLGLAIEGSTAMWAVDGDALAPLLGAWRVTVHFSDGSLDETNLEIGRAPEADEGAPGVLAFGPPGERFQGSLNFQRTGSTVTFASQAICENAQVGTAMLTGRLSGTSLQGTAFLPDQQHLVTWQAERIT